MHRLDTSPMLAAMLLLAACGPLPALDEEPNAGETSDPGGEDSVIPADAVACLGAACHAPEPPSDVRDDASCAAPEAETPACGSGIACDADGDCADHPGNYCEPAACEFQGCLRGGCKLTKISGEPCAREAECVSGVCACPEGGGQCTCGPGGGTEWDMSQ